LIGLCGGFIAATGCVDGFRGSNVEFDFAPATVAQLPEGMAAGPGELPANSRFTLYGIQEFDGKSALFALRSFEIHKAVEPTSPCFIDMGQTARFPGLHSVFYADKIAEVTGITDYRNPPGGASENDKIDAATAAQREINIELLSGVTGVKVITSASAAKYPAVSADCAGPADQLPPPRCIDEASNQKRLELCQRAWDADAELWEGTDRSLTAPLAGTTFGFVLGTSPINNAPIGGGSFFVEEALSTMDAYAIYVRTDDAADPGNLYAYGEPSKPTRGVTKVHMTTISNPNLFVDLAIFEDLGEDDVHF
jgi:hypothetical protein